jgi:hypothetical protein
LPLQVPSSPQVVTGWTAQSPCGSRVPAGTGWQLPAAPGRLQVKQAPQVAAEQQAPSTQ